MNLTEEANKSFRTPRPNAEIPSVTTDPASERVSGNTGSAMLVNKAGDVVPVDGKKYSDNSAIIRGGPYSKDALISDQSDNSYMLSGGLAQIEPGSSFERFLGFGDVDTVFLPGEQADYKVRLPELQEYSGDANNRELGPANLVLETPDPDVSVRLNGIERVVFTGDKPPTLKGLGIGDPEAPGIPDKIEKLIENGDFEVQGTEYLYAKAVTGFTQEQEEAAVFEASPEADDLSRAWKRENPEREDILTMKQVRDEMMKERFPDLVEEPVKPEPAALQGQGPGSKVPSGQLTADLTEEERGPAIVSQPSPQGLDF